MILAALEEAYSDGNSKSNVESVLMTMLRASD